MSRAIRWIGALVLCIGGPACTSYQALADPVADLATYPSQVGPARVTLRCGERIKFISLQVDGDSLRGFLKDGASKSIALTAVEKVELRMVDEEKTSALAGAIMCTLITAIARGATCEPDGEEEE